MSDQHLTDQQSAAILIALGLEPEKEESDESYVEKIKTWLSINEITFSESQINYLSNNIVAIKAQIRSKLKIREALCGIGHFGKWGYTLLVCIKKAKGWDSLVARTASYSPAKLAQLSLSRTIASRSMWWITGVIASVEVGLQFYKYCKNQISIKQFWINTGKIITLSAASVVGGAGGAYAGAAMGMVCAGPVGAILGIIVGGYIGSVGASKVTQQALEFIGDKYEEMTAKNLIQQALNFYELPNNYSFTELENIRKMKFTQYHPDKWHDATEQKQKKMAKSLQLTMENYEILNSALKAKQ